MEEIIHDFKNSKPVKARNWTAVLYPESMIPNWEDRIYRQLQVPFEYIIHNKDKVELEEDETMPRKEHIHIILHWDNTTSYNNVLKLLQDNLSALGQKCCNKVEPVRKLKYMHLYLTHETEDAKKEGKYQYKRTDIVTGNNWDIGAFVELEESTNLELYCVIRDFMISKKIRCCIDMEILIQSGALDNVFPDLDNNIILRYFVNNRTKFTQVAKEINFKFKNTEN